MRCLTGVAPVTKRSGKQIYVIRRFACNPRLRNTVRHWARSAIQHDDQLREYCQQIRTRGHGDSRALRQVSDKLLRSLAAALNNATLYQADYHRKETRAA